MKNILIVPLLIASYTTVFGQTTHKSSETHDSIICPPISYQDYYGTIYGISTYFDYEEGLQCARISKKPYLIYFTSFGSTTSREMENVIWQNSEIKESLKVDFVITKLYVDSKSSFQIKKGDTVRTDGKKNLNFEISKFKNNGLPVYFVVNQNEEILNGPFYFNLNVISFKDFLVKSIIYYSDSNKK